MEGVIDSPKVALLTLRAWCEEGSKDPLRVQIRFTGDVSSGFRSTLTVANTESVVDAVRGFLEEVLCSRPNDPAVTVVSRPGHGE